MKSKPRYLLLPLIGATATRCKKGGCRFDPYGSINADGSKNGFCLISNKKLKGDKQGIFRCNACLRDERKARKLMEKKP